MTQEQRTKLFDRLTRNLDKMCNGDELTKKLFEQSTLEDIEAIEAIIDIFLAEERIKVWGECRDMIAAKFAKKGNADGLPNNAPIS